MITYFLAHQEVFFLLIVWMIFWKGMILWHTARENKKTWFIFFLVVNTFGVLEIIYLYIWPMFKKKDNTVTGEIK